MKRRLSLLLVEDSPADAELVLVELERHGFDTTAERVDSETQLRSALSARPWDIILCDHALPSFSSTDVLRIVHEIGDDIPLVILSGAIGEEATVEALKGGVRDVVLKQHLARLGPVVDRELGDAANRRDEKHFEHERSELEAQLAQLNSELRASESHYRLLFELSPLPMLVYERGSCRIVAVNKALVSNYGYTRDEFLAMTIKDLHPPEEAGLLGEILASNPDDPQVRSRSWRHLYRDGTLIDVEITSENLMMAGRDCRIAVCNNVTGRNQANTARVKAARDTSLELAKQNEQLRVLDALKDQFVSVVSHELRTPLTAIRGYLEIVLGGEPGPLTEEQKRFLEIAGQSSEQLLRVVGDLLLIGKLEAGHLALEIGEVDLGALLDRCIAAAQPSADAKQIGLWLRHTPVPPVAGDPGRLAQALGNVISNGIKFTTDGQVEVRLYAQADRAVIEVLDSGAGVPANEVSHLFVPFYRASTATRQAIPGTGLGLSIAKEIIEAHGGTISLETKVGSGTSVRVELPFGTTR
jgi:PAS domain S-box-containing protein